MKFIYTLLITASISITAFSQATYKDVAGIFYNRCTPCHHENQHAQSMLNYSETYPWIADIQTDLSSGKMPPWSPDTTYTRFVHERTMPLAERNAILDWIGSGALKGDTTLAPTAPTYAKYRLNGTPDLIIRIPTFASNAVTKDAYNCFAIPMGLSADRIMRAVEIVPGNYNIVHHVVVTMDTTGTTTSDLSGNCFTQPGQFGIGGWAPGAPPAVFPSQAPLKMGIKIKAGSNVVIQMHYPVGTAGQLDSTEVRFYFYPVGATGIRPIHVNTYLQNWSMSIAANTVGTYTAKYPLSGTLTSDISIFSTSPHAHKVNKSMLIYAYRTSPADTIPLIHIPNWNFDLQGLYAHKNMVKIPAGYKLYSKHVYDNTTANPNNPSSPPALVIAGTSTTNEMLFDGFAWTAYQAGDELIDIASILDADSLLSNTSVSEAVAQGLKSYVFPNPAGESATLVVTNEYASNCTLRLFDLYGKEVKGDITRNQDAFIIRKNNMPSGVYFYSLKAGKATGSGKIIFMPK